MTKNELHAFVSESKGNENNICQIYAIKNGITVYNDNWHGFETDSAVNVMSVTKGVMALLIGIALDKGYIKSVQQKVLEFFPDYTVKRGEKTIYNVTLEHLLTMTAPYKYRSEPWTKVCTSDDWTKAALDLLGGKKGIMAILPDAEVPVGLPQCPMRGIRRRKQGLTGSQALFSVSGHGKAPFRTRRRLPVQDTDEEEQKDAARGQAGSVFHGSAGARVSGGSEKPAVEGEAGGFRGAGDRRRRDRRLRAVSGNGFPGPGGPAGDHL